MKTTFSLRTFSLRSLIVFTTLCGIGLAIFVSPSVKQWRMLRRCERALLADGIAWSPTVDPKGRYTLNIDGSKLSLRSAAAIAAATAIKSVCLRPISENNRLDELRKGFWLEHRLGEAIMMDRLEIDEDQAAASGDDFEDLELDPRTERA